LIKIVKIPGNGRLNNLNDPILNVLRIKVFVCWMLLVSCNGSWCNAI